MPDKTAQPIWEWLRRLLGLPPGAAESERLARQAADLGSKMQPLVDMGNYEDALRIIESSIPLLKRLWAFPDLARAYINAGWICEQVGQWRQAIGYYRRGLKEWKRMDNDRGQALAHTGLGRALMKVDEVDRGRDELETACDLFKIAKDEEGLAHSLEHLVKAYSQLGLNSEEQKKAKELLELCQRLLDKEREARALHLLGVAERKMKNYSASIDALRQAMALYQANGNEGEQMEILKELAETQAVQDHYAEALKALQEGLQLAQRNHDRASECYFLNQLGVTQTQAGHYPEAERNLREALNLIGHLPPHYRKQTEAAILFNLAGWHMRQEEYAPARDYADQATKIYEALQDYPGALQAMMLSQRAAQKRKEST